ncbi:S1 family peptidase [Nonomuraea endophytica]|uniref:Serine protease n=1 Tax=Nonomuraea endophytica TaxID=714136 RepID=A0A7W8EK93_9ACTN|nr:serine protease [Nonomuraea endophytica]MBB5081507.1 hypothetical protein [Nonomuraea endophytica]
MAIQDRFVEVIAEITVGSGPTARTEWEYASGFLIDGRHVLTSLHAVVRGQTLVRRASPGPGSSKQVWQARVLLAGDLGLADLAIVELEQDVGPLSRFGFARIAERTERLAVVEDCDAVGFPAFIESETATGATRQPAHVRGGIPIAQRPGPGLLTLQTRHSPRPLPPADQTLAGSVWSGMSGAAVLVGDHVVGVISEHAPRQGVSDLTIVPITLIDTLPDATTWWELLGLTSGQLLTLPRLKEDTASGPSPGQSLEAVTNPFLLEIHQAIDLDEHPGLPPLPAYVRRRHDRELAAAVERALAGESTLKVLVGGSSTGKTRACWEALTPLRRSGQDWRLWHPIDPSHPDAALAALTRVEPRTVVWLNEAQFYLDTPLGEQVAAGLRELLRAPDRGPVLVLATLWPEHWDTLTTRPAGGADPHAQARELLTGHKIQLPDAFTGQDAQRLADTVHRDPRLARAAAEAADGKITQYLAGVPVLLDRYRTAPPAVRALIHAAMDARRLGYGPHLSDRFLADAAPGYLTDDEWDALGDDWLEAAFAYAARRGSGIPWIITRARPRTTTSSGAPVCRLADYLEQTGRRERAGLYPPDSFWSAAARLTQPATLYALGVSAYDRGLYKAAAQLWKHATAYDSPPAAFRLLKVFPDDFRVLRHVLEHTTVDQPATAAALLGTLQELGANEEVEALLARGLASSIPLDDLYGVVALFRILREIGADEDVDALLARDLARSIPLVDLYGVVTLLSVLGEAEANEQVEALAQRAVGEVALTNPLALDSLLRHALPSIGQGNQVMALVERAVGDVDLNNPYLTIRLLELLRVAEAHEQAIALAERAVHTVDLSEPFSITRLLQGLREVGAHEQAMAFAERAVQGVDLSAPNTVGSVLEALRRAEEHEAIAVLLARDPARFVSLNDPEAIGWLLETLYTIAAQEQIAALIARDPAHHAHLDDPGGIARLLHALTLSEAHDQVEILLGRDIARTVTLVSPEGLSSLLDWLWEAGTHDEQAEILLARAPARHVALDDPEAASELLDQLEFWGAHEQVAVLADRLAREAAVDAHLELVLERLRDAGAQAQVTTLAERISGHLPLSNRDEVVRVLGTLRDAGAHVQAEALLRRLPPHGQFAVYCEVRADPSLRRNGCERDGSPAQPWGWADLD